MMPASRTDSSVASWIRSSPSADQGGHALAMFRINHAFCLKQNLVEARGMDMRFFEMILKSDF